MRAAIVLGIPFWLGDAYTSSATLAVIYAIIGVSLVVLTGWAGQISLGQFALAGIGGATCATLLVQHGTDLFVAVLGNAAGPTKGVRL